LAKVKEELEGVVADLKVIRVTPFELVNLLLVFVFLTHEHLRM
jgi:hypothetical protein